MNAAFEKEGNLSDYDTAMMTDVLAAALLASGVFYAAVQCALLVGLGRLKRGTSESRPVVSVIVAARNEEDNIGPLLRQLTRQSYSPIEIIIANDRSTDATASRVAEYQRDHPALRHVDVRDVEPGMPPKKHALAKAIGASKGEILCFTDADCVPGVQWVEKLMDLFEPDVGLVVGYSPYVPKGNPPTPDPSVRWGPRNSVLENFIAYEEVKAAVWSAGSIGLGRPWLCTGRNFAYRREVYDAVGGYERIKHSVSGDDDLFLQLAAAETSWKVRYALDPQSFVPTAPPPSFASFLNQRKRHFSAARYFPPTLNLFLGAFHAANLVVLAGLIANILTPLPHAAGYTAFALKVSADILLMMTATDIFRAPTLGTWFLFHEILYVLYNAFIGPLGLIAPFEWKPENERS